MRGKRGNSKGFDVRSAVLAVSLAMVSACTNSGEDERSAEEESSHATRVADRKITGENPSPAPPVQSVGACRTQDGRELSGMRLRAVGTEPFWNAEVDGRCVTYSSPEIPAGTRVWTRFDASTNQWEGALGGETFKLTIELQEGCSDGMSDRMFPLLAVVEVGGEERRGCAEPL
jgi:uncharacterized membrane protein